MIICGNATWQSNTTKQRQNHKTSLRFDLFCESIVIYIKELYGLVKHCTIFAFG